MLALLMPGNVVPGAELVNQSTVLPGFAACQPSPAWFEQETSARAESPTPRWSAASIAMKSARGRGRGLAMVGVRSFWQGRGRLIAAWAVKVARIS